MAVYFSDSSGVVKRYIAEIGTNRVRQICVPAAGNDLYTAHILGAEAVAAIMRRTRRSEISQSEAAIAIADLQTHLGFEYTPIYLTDFLVQSAISLAQRYPLRGYDAVQLASALALQAKCAALGLPPPIFVSADANLNAAATAEGLAVDDPNAHP